MARTKLMECGHGSRHLSPYDGRCRVCVRNAKVEGEPSPRPQGPVDKAKLGLAQDRAYEAERRAAEAKEHAAVQAVANAA